MSGTRRCRRREHRYRCCLLQMLRQVERVEQRERSKWIRVPTCVVAAQVGQIGSVGVTAGSSGALAAGAEEIKLVVDELEREFKIKDLVCVKLLLGMEINYIPGQAMCIS
jgi:hypothetical protein